MAHLDRISPSKSMRELRPECYTDTEDHIVGCSASGPVYKEAINDGPEKSLPICI